VYVSAHEHLDDFEHALSLIDFPFISFHESTIRRALRWTLRVQDFPTLLVLSPKVGDTGNRKMINPQIEFLSPSQFVEEFPYRPKQYGCIERVPEAINHQKCLMVFFENGDDEEQRELKKLMNSIAEDHGVRALWAMQPSEMSETLRLICQLGSSEPRVILLDLPDNGAYYVMQDHEGECLSRESIVEFLQHPGGRRKLS